MLLEETHFMRSQQAVIVVVDLSADFRFDASFSSLTLIVEYAHLFLHLAINVL